MKRSTGSAILLITLCCASVRGEELGRQTGFPSPRSIGIGSPRRGRKPGASPHSGRSRHARQARLNQSWVNGQYIAEAAKLLRWARRPEAASPDGSGHGKKCQKTDARPQLAIGACSWL